MTSLLPSTQRNFLNSHKKSPKKRSGAGVKKHIQLKNQDHAQHLELSECPSLERKADGEHPCPPRCREILQIASQKLPTLSYKCRYYRPRLRQNVGSTMETKLMFMLIALSSAEEEELALLDTSSLIALSDAALSLSGKMNLELESRGITPPQGHEIYRWN